MARGHYVFTYDAEPADERPTDYGSTNFGLTDLAALRTAPAPWTMSQHSTFEEPGHANDRVLERRRGRRLKSRLIKLGVLLVGTAACAVAFVAAQ